MTVLEQRFMEVAVRQLPLISRKLEEIVELLKERDNVEDTRERVRNEDNILE